jgi:hypothetical protein
MIFIIGDHGAGAQGLRIRLPEDKMFDHFVRNIYWWQANGVPLVLVKPFLRRGDLSVNDQPTSLGNIKETILRELNIDASGSSMLKERRDEEPRLFFLHYYDKNRDLYYDKKRSLYQLGSRILVRGHSWDSSSWVPDYTSIYKPVPKYEWGTPIEFGNNGNGYQYDIWYGFSAPEEGFTWTEGNHVIFALRVSPPTDDLILKLRILYVLGENVFPQVVNISLNDKPVGGWEIKHPGDYSIEIPKSILHGELLKIVFHLPNAGSPKKMDINDDERLLAIALQSLVIEEKK